MNELISYYNIIDFAIWNNKFVVEDTRDILIYLIYQYKKNKTTKVKNKILEIYQLYADDYVKKDHDLSFWYGHSGHLYLLNELNNIGVLKKGEFQKLNILLIGNIYKYINYSTSTNHRWYDMFFGLLGYTIYLDTLETTMELKTCYCSILKMLETETIKLLKGEKNKFYIIPEYYIDQSLKDDFPNGYIDLGVSHGLINVIALLDRIFVKFKDKNAIAVINNLILYYNDIILYTENNSIPERVDITREKYISKDGLLDFRWSYGTFGTIIYLSYFAKKHSIVLPIGLQGILSSYMAMFINKNFSTQNTSFVNGLSGILFLKEFYNNYVENVHKNEDEIITKNINGLLKYVIKEESFSLMSGKLSPMFLNGMLENEEWILDIIGITR